MRAHGPAAATLRRALAQLVETGIVIRRDSPNGKRYARRGQGGQVEQAFGFDLFAACRPRSGVRTSGRRGSGGDPSADAPARRDLHLILFSVSPLGALAASDQATD